MRFFFIMASMLSNIWNAINIIWCFLFFLFFLLLFPFFIFVFFLVCFLFSYRETCSIKFNSFFLVNLAQKNDQSRSFIWFYKVDCKGYSPVNSEELTRVQSAFQLARSKIETNIKRSQPSVEVGLMVVLFRMKIARVFSRGEKYYF